MGAVERDYEPLLRCCLMEEFEGFVTVSVVEEETGGVCRIYFQAATRCEYGVVVMASFADN